MSRRWLAMEMVDVAIHPKLGTEGRGKNRNGSLAADRHDMGRS